MKFLVMALLFLTCMTHGLSTCGELSSTKPSFTMNQRVLVCSRYLSCLIEQICNNNVKIIKRDTSTIMNKLVPEDLQDQMNKRRLVRETHRRPRRQIIDECCLKACTIESLMLYCPLNSKIYEEFPLGDT